MNPDKFRAQIKRSTPVGTVLDNPGEGTSEIAGISSRKLSYRRGRSIISVTFDDLYSAYIRFKGERVSSSDLKVFAPEVFDSAARPAGHSCNCTFLFLLLSQVDACGPIEGAGVRGNPFAIEIYGK